MSEQSTALAPTAKTNAVLGMNERDLLSAAEMICKSSVFGDIKSKEMAAIKIWAGNEYGFSPLQSMSMMDFIQGRPTLNAHAKATLINSSGDYRLQIVELTSQICRINVVRKSDEGKWRVIGERAFTWEDAATAGLTSGSNAHSWKKYPRNMLFARCVSNIWKWDCAELNTRPWQGTQIVEHYEPTLEDEVAPPAVAAPAHVDAEIITEAASEADRQGEKAEAVDMSTGEVIDVETVADDGIDPDESKAEDLRTAINGLLDDKVGSDPNERKKFLKGKILANEDLATLRTLFDDLNAL